MDARPFPHIQMPERPAKPRDAGLTVLIDWGAGPSAQADFLRTAGEYADLAKIAVGISGLLPSAVLAQKLELYEQFAVRPFPGGQYLEYAVSLDRAGEYLADAKEAGYRLIEVSDNTVPFERAFKEDLIGRAREGYGFDVLAEVGSKVQVSDIAALVADVRSCLGAGAWKVLVEAAELFDEGLRQDLIDALAEKLPLDKLIFELPGWWLGAVGAERAGMMRTLLTSFGSAVNLANIDPDEVLFLETLRRKTGVAGFR